MARISMIGTGYVGLVSGACLAEIGHHVICIDKNVEKIQQLQSAFISIFEPSLEDMVAKHLKSGHIQFSTHLKDAINNSEVIFIAVGTPTDPRDGRADLSYLENAAREIAPHLENYKVIVIKSTVPLGTCLLVKKIILEINPDAKFDIVSNPEFLREGSAVYDFMYPDRIIIGIEKDCVKDKMVSIYQHFSDRDIPILYTDLESSELIKYAANCFLATKIAFINEIANICEKANANIECVSMGLGLDKRIGKDYLKPSPGFGGSCFPKDTLALAHTAREMQVPLRVIEAVIESNERRKEQMVDKIKTACYGSIQGKTLAILGIAFKANTNDIRESSALTIIAGLQKEGAHIVIYDPAAMENAAMELSNVTFAKDAEHAMEGADAVVIATEWQEFCDLNFNNLDKSPTVIDLRNLYNPKIMHEKGVRYFAIGKKSMISTSSTADNFLVNEDS